MFVFVFPTRGVLYRDSFGLTGLFCACSKWFLTKLGHDGLNKLIAGFDDKTAYAQCVFSFCAGPDAEPITFDGRTPGRIVPPRGPTNFGWDPIFEPEGYNQTYAEMDKSLKNKISHRYKSLNLLREYLLVNPQLWS
jgi:inosine triphosphate pyrophosphatase